MAEILLATPPALSNPDPAPPSNSYELLSYAVLLLKLSIDEYWLGVSKD